MSNDYRTAPIDVQSAERLAAQDLRLDLVDTNDTAAFTAWLQSETRGFHAARPSEESLDAQLKGYADRRTTGVWDDSGADAASPISTVSSWPAELTVPGRSSVTAWAISAVTVSPTHRRRGIARALLEAELRTAHSIGVPVAMLTVSEATIYRRYGFAPAAMMTDWKIDTQRARWTGPDASGRVQFVTLEQLLSDGPALVERVRLATPGQMEFSGILWERLLKRAGDKELASQLRFVRYDDGAGAAQGFAIYRVTESPSAFSSHVLELQYLVAATDDAYAGLWRFLLEQDLVNEVTASLRPIDEAVAWQISDFRAAHRTNEHDHLWTRILDLKVALESRRYGVPGRIVLTVADPLGFCAGTVLLDVAADGSSAVTPFDGEIPDDAVAVALAVNELSALLLGGVSAVAFARAGLVTELRDGSATAVDAAFRSAVAPWLSIWF